MICGADQRDRQGSRNGAWQRLLTVRFEEAPLLINEPPMEPVDIIQRGERSRLERFKWKFAEEQQRRHQKTLALASAARPKIRCHTLHESVERSILIALPELGVARTDNAGKFHVAIAGAVGRIVRHEE